MYYYIDDDYSRNYYIQDYQGPRSIKEGLIILRELRACLARSAGEQVEPLGESPDRTYGLDLYDFEARRFDAIVPVFDRPDPLAEDFTWLTPYNYCAGDPVNCVDPDGMETRVIQNEDGTYQVIGGVLNDDRNIYLYTQDEDGNYTVRGASIGQTTSTTSFWDSDNANNENK